MEHKFNTQINQSGRLMKEFVDTVISFYQNIKQQDVSRIMDAQTLSRLQQQEIPAQGRPMEEVYHQLLEDVYPNTSLMQHPRCFACIPSPVSLLSWMGDVMTNAFDPHAGCWLNSSGTSCIEQQLIQWMGSLAGYPEGRSGMFVSGGSMANLTALTAARDNRLREDEWSQGVAYVSDQTHSSVAKGLHIIGFRADQVRKIPTDSQFRMDIDALKQALKQDIANSKKPFAVIATAGTTNTGSIDPLPEIATICQQHHLWMHVDGAFGASILLSEKCRPLLKGIEQSDSLSWDAHKWLMQTYGCSVVLVRDQSTLLHSFATHPEYLRDAQECSDTPNFWDLGPELTRPVRGVKLWLTLQAMGSEAVGEMIDHGCAMARLAEKALVTSGNWEIVSHAQQGIVNFRYAPAGRSKEELDCLNTRIAQEITASGYAMILTTELNGNKVLRMCTLHPETTEEDIISTINRLCNSRAIAQERYQFRTPLQQKVS